MVDGLKHSLSSAASDERPLKYAVYRYHTEEQDSSYLLMPALENCYFEYI